MEHDQKEKSEKRPTEEKKGTSIPYIEPGCIACGSCQFIAPEVFQVTDRSRVFTDADFEKNAALIEKAATACPVNVIKLKKDE